MKFIDFEKTFKRDEVYYCGSRNLYRFLRYIKNIHEIGIKHVPKKSHNTDPPNKDIENIKYIKCYIFVKCQKLQECLLEWSENKVTGNLIFPSKIPP